jgi:hypothetical protein
MLRPVFRLAKVRHRFRVVCAGNDVDLQIVAVADAFTIFWAGQGEAALVDRSCARAKRPRCRAPPTGDATTSLHLLSFTI